jgi:hypothetical protein
MKKFIATILKAMVAAALLTYLGDYAFWRHKVATGHNAYGTVTVQYYYASQMKDGKTEYDFPPPQQETCANSLFPHSGYRPCWYERKHTERAIHLF